MGLEIEGVLGDDIEGEARDVDAELPHPGLLHLPIPLHRQKEDLFQKRIVQFLGDFQFP